MSDFVKPVRVTVSVRDAFRALLDCNIVKDLHDNEEICPVCGGTGMRIEDNVYGLTEDPDKTVGRFPYKHQSISFCQNCYNGVVRRCQYCGKQLPRGRLVCDCDYYVHKREQERDKKERDAMADAEKHPSSALGTTFRMAQSDFYPHNDGYFSEWEEFFDAWNEENEEITNRPKYVWGTDETEMQMDAADIVERATEDMYDDAMSDIGDAPVKELQQYLDGWIAEYGVKSYCETNKHAIEIPWKEYDNGKEN